MPTFNLSLSRTNYPGISPRIGQLARPNRPILPSLGLTSTVPLAANVVAAKLPEQPRVWRQSACPVLTPSLIAEVVASQPPAPSQWLETGLGILGQWGTVSLASLILSAAAGATVAPAAILVAGGAALVGTVGSLALSASRQRALEAQQQVLQLSLSRELQVEVIQSDPCQQFLPPPCPAQLGSGGGGGEPVAVLPEWWPPRPGADRKQLVLLFARVKDDGSLDKTRCRITTIPHYIGDYPPMTPPIGEHRRGPYLVELTLKDNSKIRIFAASEEEGRRVLAQARALVDPNFIPEREPSVKKMETDGYYETFLVRPIRATLFPRGQRVEEEGGRPIVVYYDVPS